MWSIRQTGNSWDVVRADGTVLSSHPSYEAALAVISDQLATAAAAAGDGSSPGVLAERWTSTTGIAFREQPDPERNFTNCEWSFRDPAVYPLPLMLQTTTDIGHFGAVLAGFMDTVDLLDGGARPTGSGGFYDSDAGRQFRDMLASGNRFGVSVDPGDVEAEFVCTEQDEDGWCLEGAYEFAAYQIIGLTGTPFPAFPNATIELAGAAPAASDDDAASGDDGADEEASALTASAVWSRPRAAVTAAAGDAATALAAPIEPPRSWFFEPEPEPGDDRLVEQEDGTLACPLTILPTGQWYGHVARWGQCHVSNPQGPNICTSPPEDCTYQGFHLGVTRCDDGDDVATGAMFIGSDHPALHLSAGEARDAYAATSAAWGDARMSNGAFGPWACGALRPNLSALQVRILRASSLSGDWRELLDGPGRLEFIAGLAVNTPGFPVQRAAVLAAGGHVPAHVATRARVRNGAPVALVASGIVTACPECARRSSEPTTADVLAVLAQATATLARIDARTEHLAEPAAEALRARVARTSAARAAARA